MLFLFLSTISCKCSHRCFIDYRVKFNSIEIEKGETVCVEPKYRHLFLIFHSSNNVSTSMIQSNTGSFYDLAVHEKRKLPENTHYIYFPIYGRIEFTPINNSKGSIRFTAFCVPDNCSNLWFTNKPGDSFDIADPINQKLLKNQQTTCILFSFPQDTLAYTISTDLRDGNNFVKIVSQDENDKMQQTSEIFRDYPINSLTTPEFHSSYFEIGLYSTTSVQQMSLYISPLYNSNTTIDNSGNGFVRIRSGDQISATTLIMYATVFIMIGSISAICVIYFCVQKKKPRRLTSGTYKSVDTVDMIPIDDISPDLTDDKITPDDSF